MRESNLPDNIPSPLLITNLYVPQLHGDLISRNILIDRMNLGLNFPLTLVSAPAGFGKTTLLSQWIGGSMLQNSENRVAWISLEGDCDVSQFWRYVATALERQQLGISPSALAFPDTHQPPTNTLSRVLINQLAAMKHDLVLILDEYDRAGDPAIHTSLAFFIDHLPSHVHVVIASRSYPALPLARWRASSQLYELREDDLRFTSKEIAAFFNELKGLNLSADEIGALEKRTEGWIAGLQLVALSLRDAGDVSKRQFVHDFTGSQKYILDYLVEEVLQQQPENIRSFLMHTSVLDQLSAPLCNEVTGQSDSQAVLEYLERAHLFTIPLDHDRRWYRYHNLFLDVLRHRLQQRQSDILLELHLRAAAWYARAGQIDEAIRHACAAQSWQQAIEHIRQVIKAAWNRGDVRKIISWLGKLPDEQLDAHPQLSLYYSRALLLGGKMEAAKQRLKESEKVLRTRPSIQLNMEDRLLLGTICAFRTTICAVTGDIENALALGNEALTLLPQENVDIRAHTINSLGVNYYYLGEMEEANRACTEAGSLAQQTGNLYLVLVSASYRAKALICQGQLIQAGQVLQQALELSATPGLPVQSWMPAASVVCAGFGDLLYECNRLEEAEPYVADAIDLGQRLIFGSALWSAYHTLARIKLARGDLKGTQIEIDQAHRYRLTYNVPLPERLMNAEEARANLALGQLDAVRRWAATIQSEEPRSPSFVQEVEDMLLARLYLLQGEPGQALDLLDSLRSATESNGRKGHLIQVLLLTGLAQHANGNLRLAIDTIHNALELAEPEGYLRTFVDAGQPMAALLYEVLAHGIMANFVSRLLQSFPTVPNTDVASADRSSVLDTEPSNNTLIEPLSERELEVLQLLASGATNEDIAKKLVIAITTAKKHVSNILHKLSADNRTQAVARGRSLGLCE